MTPASVELHLSITGALYRGADHGLTLSRTKIPPQPQRQQTPPRPTATVTRSVHD